MKDTKEKILFESAKLFMKQGFDGTSVAEIAEAVGISPSSIFSHFKSKEEIFHIITDRIILSQQDPALKFNITECSLHTFIDSYANAVEFTMQKLMSYYGEGFDSIDYMSFILEVCKKYEYCVTAMTNLNTKEIDLWQTIIENAKESGEIRKEIDSVWAARMCRYTYAGMSYLFCFNGRTSADALKDVLYKFYDLIKK